VTGDPTSALLPRTTPYRPRHRIEDAARRVAADLDRDVALRNARLRIRERMNVMRTEDTV
jgi:hypothetical protein